MRKQTRKFQQHDNEKGGKLIRDLENDPERFAKNGQALGLLNELYNGFPVELLRPLLSSDNPAVRYEAVRVVEELGAAGEPLLDDIFPLLGDENELTARVAAEIALNVGNIGEYLTVFGSRFYRVIGGMSERYLEWVTRNIGLPVHERGLAALLNKNLTAAKLDAMRGSEDGITRKYAKIKEEIWTAKK